MPNLFSADLRVRLEIELFVNYYLFQED